MSFCSTSYQCGYLPDDNTVTVALIGASGDLEQVYSGAYNNPTILSENWDTATTKPCLANVVMYTDPTVGTSDVADMISDADTEYYINDKKIEFDNSGISIDSTTGGAVNVTGLFRKLTAAAGARHRADAPFGGLEVRKNLVSFSLGVSLNVKVVLAIVVSGKGVRKQGGTLIKIRQSSGQSNIATIYCDSNQTFILDNDHATVTCKVRCWQGGSEVTPSFYKWYLLENGAWVQKATTATFVVSQDDIATFGDVKVECYDSAGVLIASDMQTVSDTSDGYVISPNPTPADGTLCQTGGPSQIVFNPKLQNMDGTNGPACKFLFTVLDSVGNVLNQSDSTVKKTSYTLLQAVAQAINEGPTVNITAVEP